MGARVFVFAPTLRRTRQTAPDSTRQSMNSFLNDCQIIALEMPAAMAWLQTLAHELAQHSLSERPPQEKGRS